MEHINYPILHFKYNDRFCLGILVGSDYCVIEKDIKSVKSSLLSYLQKQYKKYDDYPIMDLERPILKTVEIPISPAYQNNQGYFPMSYTLNVPVPVVYGEVEQGYYECFLPLFEKRFFYYDERQFDTLVKHYCTSLLNQQSPEKLFQLMRHPKPMLDFITLKVKPDRDFEWDTFYPKKRYRTLSRLAEKYPLSKQVKKTTNAYPEVAWELEEVVANVIEKIIHTRSNIILVGEHGVGKSAVLQQAIKKISQQKKGFQLNISFWRISAQRITASSKYLGEWEKAVEDLLEDLISANGILWVVDLVQLLQTGGQGPEDSVAAFLSNYLHQSRVQIIGEATPKELDSMRRLLPGFVEHFQVIRLEKISPQKTQRILDKFAGFVKQKHKIDIKEAAIELSQRLLNRYFPYESFPGKGIKFLGGCVNKALLKEEKTIDNKSVIEQFIEKTGLPELFLRDDLYLDQYELHQYFKQRIKGQPNAIDKMVNIVKVYKAGLNNPNKPISTLLFAGPTGVGKTASAKALADYFFGKGQKKSPLIRIDMSEFQHPAQIYRLIGSGKKIGQLVKEVRERPFAVLLLDEIEKAHPSIFDILLSLLDEGIITDNYGRVTNFRNAIIVMTSNLGASNQYSLGFNNKTATAAFYSSAIEKHFRPEFVNRIDHIVTFQALSKSSIRQITLKELDDLKQREGFVKRGLQLEFSDNVINHLTEIGFDSRFGARPLQRAIEQSIISPFAKWLLNHREVRDQQLHIDYDGGQLQIKPI